jgi:hypothetical protein
MAESDCCPACGRALTHISVPPALREFAPERAAVVGSCPRCLRTVALSDDNAEDNGNGSDPITGPEPPDAVPRGEGGAALLLILGSLDSVALNRAAIEAFVDHAEQAGTDVFLALNRLADADGVDAHADLGRRRRQLETMLEY